MAFEPEQTSSVTGGDTYASKVFTRIEQWLEADRDQIPLWLPVCLGLGIIVWFALPNPVGWMGWTFATLGVAMLALLCPEGSRLRHCMILGGLITCGGCLLVWGRAQWLEERPLARPVFTTIVGEVVDVDALPAQKIVRVVLHPIDREDLPGKIRINIPESKVPEGVLPGAVLSLRSRLMPPAPPAVPGAYNFAQRAYFQGLGATGRAVAPISVVTPAPAGAGLSLRDRLTRHVQGQIEGGAGAIAATLATGDRGGISEEDAEAMRRSGLAHLLSISGLHVTALIGAVIFMLVKLLALSPTLALRWPLLLVAAGGGAVAGIGYTLLTGAEVPTIRSCIAALLVLGALALGREAISLRLVAAGATFVLLFWPESLLGPSFQMSFAAVIVIVTLYEWPPFAKRVSRRDEAWIARTVRALIALFVTSLAIEIVLTPIAFYHFHQAGIYGAVANLVAIPLTTFVVMPLEALALFLDLFGLGMPIWWLVGLALNFMLWVAHFVSDQPGSVSLLPAFPGWAFGLFALGSLWICFWRSRLRLTGLALVLPGLIAMAVSPAPDVLVTGDGQHMVVRTPDGRLALLRDGAGDYVRDVLAETAGYEGEMPGISDLPEAKCSADICSVNVMANGRQWTILATRSRILVPVAALARDCARADIVVSERRLPRTCVPRWLKLDRRTLRKTGGVALYLSKPAIRTVRQPGDEHPWVQ